jgi:hypothetical protein
MLRNIEILQTSVMAHARKYWEDEDMRFLLQSEYSNLAACKQAIMWTIGWSDELITKRALAVYQRAPQDGAAYE